MKYASNYLDTDRNNVNEIKKTTKNNDKWINKNNSKC